MSGKQKLNEVSTIERAFDLIQRLQAGQRLTPEIVADIYHVTRRTGERLVTAAGMVLPVRVTW